MGVRQSRDDDEDDIAEFALLADQQTRVAYVLRVRHRLEVIG